MTGAAVEVEGLTCVYGSGDEAVVALDDVGFTVAPGGTVAVLGPSGSGKSTLLAVLAGLQRPTRGTVRIGGLDLGTASQRRLTAMRREQLAVVVQDPRRNLLPHGTAADNVRFAQDALRSRRSRDPEALLRDLGLGQVMHEPIDRLSGGERQRVAIATGLAIEPGVLLVDEPTSALDRRSRDDVVALLTGASRRTGATLIVITHDQEVAARFGEAVVLDAGRQVLQP